MRKIKGLVSFLLVIMVLFATVITPSAAAGSLSGSTKIKVGSNYLSKTCYSNYTSPNNLVYATAWISSGSAGGGNIYGKYISRAVIYIECTSTVARASGYRCHSGGLRSDSTDYVADAFACYALN